MKKEEIPFRSPCFNKRKKYGITEEEINELIRLRYITSSFIHDEPDIKNELFVDTDEIEDLLEFNADVRLPNDETVKKVPIKTLELMKCTRELIAVANQVRSLDETIANDIQFAITKRNKRLWKTLCRFFRKR